MAKRYKKRVPLVEIKKGRLLRKSDIGTQITNGGQTYDVLKHEEIWNDTRERFIPMYLLKGSCKTCGQPFTTHTIMSSVYFNRNCNMHKKRPGPKLKKIYPASLLPFSIFD
jgi:hypothetical protein